MGGDFIIVQLDKRSAVPVFKQITEKITNMIIAEVLKADDKLPSVRDLARDLVINSNTIQKSYTILEMEGYIYSLPGKGVFVAELNRQTINKRKNGILDHLNNLIKSAHQNNISKDEILNIIESIYR